MIETQHGPARIMRIYGKKAREELVEDKRELTRIRGSYQKVEEKEKVGYPKIFSIGKGQKQQTKIMHTPTRGRQIKKARKWSRQVKGYPAINIDDDMNKTMGVMLGYEGMEKEATFLMDQGASGSLISYADVVELGLENNIREWDGFSFSSSHASFEIIGKLFAKIRLLDTVFKVTWCVVRDTTIPILGLDFLHHHQVRPKWTQGTYRAMDPENPERKVDIPMKGSPWILRAINKQKIKKGTSSWVDCVLSNPSHQPLTTANAFLIEPSIFTRGALRVSRALDQSSSDNPNILRVMVSNFDDTSVTIHEKALVATAELCDWYKELDDTSTLEEEREEADRFEANIHGIESFKEYVDSSQEDKEKVENVIFGAHHDKVTASRIKQFFKDRKEGFAPIPMRPDEYLGPPMIIDTKGAIPLKQRAYPSNPFKRALMEEHIDLMKKHGIIEYGKGPWASPVVMAKKKTGAGASAWRFCIDFRYVNSQTKKNAYPLPNITETLEHLGNKRAKVFSTMDLASGYWHIPISAKDKEKTGFTTGTDLYQFTRMPFGLTAAPGTFCKAVNECLSDSLGRTCLVLF
jgi:hypothetical protein